MKALISVSDKSGVADFAKALHALGFALLSTGGTAKLLVHEIHAVFGEHAFIPEDPEYVNVDGFLRKMCADFGIDIGASSKKDGDAA